MALPRVRLGELLVEAQIISREQLDQVLQRQKRDGRRLGAMVVEAGYANEAQVTQILSHQLSVPWVSLYRVEFSRDLLDSVPAALAKKHGVIPLFTRRVRGVGKMLYVAMEDPSDEAAQSEVADASGLPVRAMIAPPSEIRAAVHIYYALAKDAMCLADAMAELRPDEASSILPEAARAAAGRAARNGNGAPATAHRNGSPVRPSRATPEQPVRVEPGFRGQLESDPEIEIQEVSLVSHPEPERQRLELAFFDGSELALSSPVSLKEGRENPVAELSSAELLATLRASLHGVTPMELIGESVRWEALLGAMLSLLIRKGVMLDREFMEEYRKLAG